MALNVADLAIITNLKAFGAAFEKLCGMVTPERHIPVYDAVNRYFLGLRATTAEDPHSPFEDLQSGEGAMVCITLLHVTLGTPLFITDELLDQWTASDAATAECPRDGYRVPKQIRTCPICSGATGEPGDWSKRRARLAGLN